MLFQSWTMHVIEYILKIWNRVFHSRHRRTFYYTYRYRLKPVSQTVRTLFIHYPRSLRYVCRKQKNSPQQHVSVANFRLVCNVKAGLFCPRRDETTTFGISNVFVLLTQKKKQAYKQRVNNKKNNNNICTLMTSRGQPWIIEETRWSLKSDGRKRNQWTKN